MVPAPNPDGPLVDRLARLFSGAPVVGEEMRLSGDVPAPHPDEAAQVARAVGKRKLEFAAGRHCARLAFRKIVGQPTGGADGELVLLNDADRAPRWPDGFVGSLTHTGVAPDGYCAVVLGRSSQLLTVGLDAEEAEPLEDALWSFVLTESERHALLAHPENRRGLLAKVMFSAKECFYKAQYPITRRFLGFREVQIDLFPELERFEAHLLAPAADSEIPEALYHCEGRFILDGAFILTGIALPRIAPKAVQC